jgi:hypothetical protein
MMFAHLSLPVDVGVDEASHEELVQLLVGGGVAVMQSLITCNALIISLSIKITN